MIIQLNLAISNSTNSKSPLLRSQAESPRFERDLMLTRLIQNAAISNIFSCPAELRNSEIWPYYQFSLPHLYLSLSKVGRMYFDRVNPFTPKLKKYILPTFERDMYKWGSERLEV